MLGPNSFYNIFTFKKFLVASIVATGIFSFFTPKLVFADAVNIILNVHVCNANDICEPVIGENYGSCPMDCPPPPMPTSTPTSTPDTGLGGTSGNGAVGPGGYSSLPTETFMKGINGGVQVAPYRDRAVLTFETYLPVLLNVSWGTSATYEMGSSAQTMYHQKFNVDISNLLPGTTYYFRLQLLDTLGRVVEYESYFTTTTIPDFTTLPVVQNLKALTIFRSNENQGKEAQISWDIPNLPTNERVRLVRSDQSFPTDPYDGRVIYEGRGSRVIDSNMVPDKNYYYALFVIGENDTYSAPAVIKFKLGKNPNTPPVIPDSDKDNANLATNSQNINESNGGNTGVYSGSGGIIYDPLLQNPVPLYLETTTNNEDRLGFCGSNQAVLPALSLHDSYVSPEEQINNLAISFLQNGKKIEAVNGIIRVEYNSPLVIHVDKKVAKNDKDRIGICLVSKVSGGESYYLFTKNADGDFELVFPAIIEKTVEKNHYQFTLGMLKFSGQEEVFGKGEIAYIPKETKPSIVPEIVVIFGTGLLIFLLRFFIGIIKRI